MIQKTQTEISNTNFLTGKLLVRKGLYKNL